MPQFAIPSSDLSRLQEATRVARAFAQPYRTDGIVGIVFLGAIARGYFDRHADIDLMIFKAAGANFPHPCDYMEVDSFRVHWGLADYETEVKSAWEMPKRWAFSQAQVHHDPQGQVQRLLRDKVPLNPEERRLLLIEGMTQSEWYINELSRVWIDRGSLLSAQHMFNQGLTHFLDALFALNNELVADVKWRIYCAGQLDLRPPRFHERMQEVLVLRAFTAEDVERRRRVFMEMWQCLLPAVEEYLQMAFSEFRKLV